MDAPESALLVLALYNIGLASIARAQNAESLWLVRIIPFGLALGALGTLIVGTGVR